MEWIDLRNPYTERTVGVAAADAGAVVTYECKKIGDRLRLFLLRQGLHGEKERLLFSAAAKDGPAPGGYAFGQNGWLMAAVWDGAGGMDVFGISPETGAQSWRRHVEWPGKMDWFFPLAEGYFLARFQLPEQDPLYNRFQKAFGVRGVIFLYGREGVWLVKDPVLAGVAPEQAHLQDGMVVLQQSGMTEQEKEYRYVEERSQWIGRPQAKDAILVGGAESLIKSIVEGADALPFQTVAQVGIDSFARFNVLADGKLYYRYKFFPSQKEKLCAWELGTGQVQEICPWQPGCLQEGERLYRAEQKGAAVHVTGLRGSELDAMYATRYGCLKRVLDDRYLVLSNPLPEEKDALVTLLDAQTGESRTWESAWSAEAGRLILW